MHKGIFHKHASRSALLGLAPRGKCVSLVLCLTLTLLMANCGRITPGPASSKYDQVGIASYYHDKYQGRKTASGEAYDKDAYTAAHRKLAFGTTVLVTNLQNGKTVQVRVNDRGPFVKGRIIDLSRIAAEEIEIISQGLAKVGIQY